MPGENPDDALAEAETLSERGITTVVTCLGENVETREEAEGAVRHYEAVLDAIQNRGLPTHLSVKLTSLGLDQGVNTAATSLKALCGRAAEWGNFVWVDMEYSRYVDATLEAFHSARAGATNLGLCLQAYLHRTPDDLESLAAHGIPIRLVKGAYREAPSVAIQRKDEVDDAFEALAIRLLELASRADRAHGIATHDLSLIERIHRRARSEGLDPTAAEIQMLYGIQRPAQQRFAAAGFPTRVLISYGDAWFPWYMRRLAERPANVGFVLRSMMGG
jgi:proline dehydrogenase